MWICPNCRAENYEKGACECCGYSKDPIFDVIYKIKYWYTPSRTGETVRPMDIWYSESVCLREK